MNHLSKAQGPALAPRVTGIGPSATVEMTEQIRSARATGKKILSFASGDPNITTHPAVIEAAHRALLEGDTHYGPAAGISPLREAIAARLAGRSVARYTADEVLITPGGKFAVFAALMSVVMPGDEVIIFDPCWVSYGPCIQLCGGQPIVIPSRDGIPLEYVATRITPKTRMMIVNSPVNPTGRVLSRAELVGLAKLAKQHDLWLLFDQVYSDLVFNGEFVFMQDIEDAQDRTFVADSLSKTYGMTGWRVGFVIAPLRAIKPLLRVIQHSIYCVPPFIQAAAVAALALPETVIEDYRRIFSIRRDKAVSALNRLNGINCVAPDATFYLFPSVDRDDRAVAQEWLEKLSIAALPGSSFGADGAGHLRLSLACSDHDLDQALHKLSEHCGVTSAAAEAGAR